MRKLHELVVVLLTTGMLAGCSALSIATQSVVMPVPTPRQAQATEFPAGYSLGPNANEDLSVLIPDAVPSDEGSVYFAGSVLWTGMERFETKYKPDNSAIVAITDLHILFIWWSETENSYKVLIKIPFEQIYWVNLRASRTDTSIKLCHENHPTFLDKESIFFGNETQLYVLNSRNRRDNEKTNEVFWLLDKLINQDRESTLPRSLCD